MDALEHPQIVALRRTYFGLRDQYHTASNMLGDMAQAGLISQVAYDKGQEIVMAHRDAMDAAEAALWLAVDLLCPQAAGQRYLHAWLDDSNAVPA